MKPWLREETGVQSVIHAKVPRTEPSGHRSFETGATRDQDTDKLDFEGFLSPLVLERYAEYMHRHRKLPDGSMRDSDNWQKGIPPVAYMKSAWRHFRSWWRLHRGYPADESIEDALCGLIFNASGYLHEHLEAGAGATAAQRNLEAYKRNNPGVIGN